MTSNRGALTHEIGGRKERREQRRKRRGRKCVLCGYGLNVCVYPKICM